jgi:hypothetical protein
MKNPNPRIPRIIYPLLVVIFAIFNLPVSAQVPLDQGWRFYPGKESRVEETGRPIDVTQNWEKQGFDSLDGYAWYKLKFFLPARLLTQSSLKKDLQFQLGTLDDADKTYLNGTLIGSTGIFPDKNTDYQSAWNHPRVYKIPTDHPAIRWEAENELSVLVYDGGGPGGFFSTTTRAVHVPDIIDYLEIDTDSLPFTYNSDRNFATTLFLKNHADRPVEATFHVKTGKKYRVRPIACLLPAAGIQAVQVTYPNRMGTTARCQLTLKGGGANRIATQEIPYILTPPEKQEPRITNPPVYGARPQVPFLYKIAATGKAPMSYAAAGLPTGLRCDPKNGVISGQASIPGMHNVLITATNSLGSASQNLVIVIGNNMALTPPLGWNSWNCWGLEVSDQRVRSSADALVQSGLINHGWTYLNIDDGWEAAHRDPLTHRIRPNEKFPDMKALSEYLHQQGLKMGIYSSPGPTTCGGYLGSWEHEQLDAQTWADWGIDYLKYDWCSYGTKAPSIPSRSDYQKPYQLMQTALKNVNRDIVYSLCQYGMDEVWEWGESVGGNLWRTTGDITDTWESMAGIGFEQDSLHPFAHPGHWNDPDMLVVGQLGWGDQLRTSRLTPNEQYTHITLWSMLSAPLLIGCDLSKMDAFTYNLLSNDEVLAINQDPGGKQAHPIYHQNGLQVWRKELYNGKTAVALFNTTQETINANIPWAQLINHPGKSYRDAWRQQNIGKCRRNLTTRLLPHGTRLLVVD